MVSKRNPVAKYARRVNRASVQRCKVWQSKQIRKQKHKHLER